MRTLKRKLFAASGAIAAWIAASAPMALAHGGMASPDELGRPLAMSAALAFACYWAVMLWPSRKRNDSAQVNHKRSPSRRGGPRHPMTGGNGESRATSLKAVGRGSDG